MTKQEHQTAAQNLLREQLKGITLENVTKFDELKGDEQRDFLKYAYFTYHDKHFKQIIEALINVQVYFSVNHAVNYDQTTFARATVNGLSLLKEFFQGYAKLYESRFLKETEDFDKHKLLGN